jgi:hypothetical protein
MCFLLRFCDFVEERKTGGNGNRRIRGFFAAQNDDRIVAIRWWVVVVSWWLVSGLVAVAEGGYLVAVSAGDHAAPAAMVGSGSVVEPEDALGVFAAAD